MNDGPRRARVATVVAVVAVVAAALGAAACGSDGGVVVHVSQDPAIAAPIDRLHLYVGVDDGTAFAGVPRPEDDIALATPLTARAHTIALVAGDGMPTDRPLRVAVVGYAGDVDIRDLWNRVDMGTFQGVFSTELAPHASALYHINHCRFDLDGDGEADSTDVLLFIDDVQNCASN